MGRRSEILTREDIIRKYPWMKRAIAGLHQDMRAIMAGKSVAPLDQQGVGVEAIQARAEAEARVAAHPASRQRDADDVRGFDLKEYCRLTRSIATRLKDRGPGRTSSDA